MEFRVAALVTNVPGPLAAFALHRDGAQVVKIEPPQGDPLFAAAPEWYAGITAGIEVLVLDLRDPAGRERFENLLARADLLLTSTRATVFERLGLDWVHLHERHPRLCHVAIFGEHAPHADRAGHDLTYQAKSGLIDPPSMPRTVYADLFAAERATAQSYRLLLQRERSGEAARSDVAIAAGAAELAAPFRYGLTSPDGLLGGISPVYRFYQTADGWIALAALEPHFQARLREALGLATLEAEALAARFAERSCAHWEHEARRFDLPLCTAAPLHRF